MSPLWITKHQSRLPSVFISFFVLSSDPTTSTLHDNKVKAEISNIRSIIGSTSYKTKLVIVLIGDSVIDTAEADERTNNIRRATGLEQKSLAYFAANLPREAATEFAANLLNNVYPISVEYYRDLSKHARRKRNRNSVPPPTIKPSHGTSQVLDLQGWNVRYEFKLGVFAEFRQEMEAAVRNYETAYDILFGPETFEAVPSWSPRFNETRLLADVIAIRIIRGLLWMGQTTNAVRSWISHRDRIGDIVDRRGTGTGNYGWESWQTIWSKTMADLIQRSQVLPMPENSQSESNTLFIHSEKTLPPTDRYAPWESLHHEGYWMNLAQRHTQNRRMRALEMSEEDRASPGQSPASTIASKSHLYDKYLTPEPYIERPLDDRPGYDYTSEILRSLDAAIRQFTAHSQLRMSQVLQLKKAMELIRSSAWRDAATILMPIWRDSALRRSGWWLLVNEIGNALLICTLEMNDKDTLVQLNWELSHPQFAISKTLNSRLDHALSRLDSTDLPRVALSTESCLSSVIPHFSFGPSEGHVGKPVKVQLSTHCLQTVSGRMLRPSQVKVVFEGGLRPICLTSDDQESVSAERAEIQIIDVELSDAASISAETNKRSSISTTTSSRASTDLTLGPGQIKVYQFEVTPREAGDVSVASITIQMDDDQYELTVTAPHTEIGLNRWWEMRQGKIVSRPFGKERDVSSITILPKPPKVAIETPTLQNTYYTNEDVGLKVRILNGEDEPVSGHLEARIISASKNAVSLRWQRDDKIISSSSPGPDGFVQVLPQMTLDEIDVEQSVDLDILVSNTEQAVDHELELVLTYTLPSAPDTTLVKSIAIDLPVVRPFESNFGFHSRYHPDQWPNFFSTSSISRDASAVTGIKQQYSVSALLYSFAAEDLIIESTNLTTQKIVGNATCSTNKSISHQDVTSEAMQHSSTASVLMRSEQTHKFNFDMTLQKLVLGDGQPVAVDLHLEIQWRRSTSSHLNRSVLQLPRFLTSSSEPRVLVRVKRDSADKSLCHLFYTIENPSLHFLTFNLTMESSEDFAFSGPKSKSISLVPVSRVDVQYRILSNKVKEWIKVNLEVVDAYFGQTLKVQPASEGVRVDKQGHVMLRLD